jgi:hypothetical protein
MVGWRVSILIIEYYRYFMIFMASPQLAAEVL